MANTETRAGIIEFGLSELRRAKREGKVVHCLTSTDGTGMAGYVISDHLPTDLPDLYAEGHQLADALMHCQDPPVRADWRQWISQLQHRGRVLGVVPFVRGGAYDDGTTWG